MNDFQNPLNMNETDHILESLRPRMQAARIAHVRRLAVGVVAVPVFGFGVAAMAASGAPADLETETATAGDEIAVVELDEATLPEIGDGETEEVADDTIDEADVTVVPEAESGDDEPVETTTTTTVAADPNAPTDVELGALGWVQVLNNHEGLSLGPTTLTDGWELVASDGRDGSLTLMISDGTTTKVVSIVAGPRNEILASVDEFVPPTTTTTVAPTPVAQPEKTAEKVTNKPEDDATSPAPVSDQFTVTVAGKGSFTVSRDGDKLYLGTVDAVAGYTAEVQRDSGWKVYVSFSDGETLSFGKAFINDSGAVEQHFWDENIGPQPTYQWVDIPEVGSAKFEFLDGQIRVFKMKPGDGFSAIDANGGGSSGTGRVVFSGDGVTWLADAWIDGNGELATGYSQG